MEELLRLLINENRYDYKCFDVLKQILRTNPEFREIIKEGLLEEKISGFDEELWSKIHSQNIRVINNFEDVFKDGANIGYCTVASKQLSYSLDRCYLCGGVLPILRGTPNCIDGSHTWIVHEGKIIDTSLMLIIDEEYALKLGYKEENRYDPNKDPIYNTAKEFTNDETLKRK